MVDPLAIVITPEASIRSGSQRSSRGRPIVIDAVSAVQANEPAQRQELEADVVEREPHDLLLRGVDPEGDERALVELLLRARHPDRGPVTFLVVGVTFLEEPFREVLDAQHPAARELLATGEVVVARLELEVEPVRLGEEARPEIGRGGQIGRVGRLAILVRPVRLW